MTDLMQQIDSAKYLYLRSIHEPEDNVLLLVVQEAGASGHSEVTQIGEATFSGYQDIVSGEKDLAYEVLFPNYISYAVTNEAFGIVDDAEVRSGRLFSIYTKSHFLNFVQASTLATEDYPGPFTHYQVNCLNHTIDVVSTSEPDIKVLESSFLNNQL
jgi:hypothetical protein